jgi:hypothetical protein
LLVWRTREKQQFHKWARAKELRHCPNCMALIEKNMGCNNMHWYALP